MKNNYDEKLWGTISYLLYLKLTFQYSLRDQNAFTDLCLAAFILVMNWRVKECTFNGTLADLLACIFSGILYCTFLLRNSDVAVVWF